MRVIQKKKANNINHLQRKPFFNKDEAEGPASSSENAFFSSSFKQTKLFVGRTNDSYETEADSVADTVVERINTGSKESNPKISQSNSSTIQTKANNAPLNISKLPSKTDSLQKSEDEADQKSEGENENQPVQAKLTSADSDDTSTEDIDSSSGSSMDADTQSDMEDGFGTDFSNVNIHTGSEAAKMNQDLNSRAFTQGSDIYFNDGQYDTSSTEGKKLIAHELTHTIQQGATPEPKPKEKTPEKEAVDTEMPGRESEAETDKKGAAADEKPEEPGKEAKDKKEGKDKKEAKAEDKKEKKAKGKKKKPKLDIFSFLGKKKEKAGGGAGGGGGGGAARATDMSEPALDGGPENMATKTEESKGAVDRELKGKSEGVFQRGKKKAAELAKREKDKEDPGTKLKIVEASVEIKPEEKQSEANNKQVAKVDATPEPPVKDAEAKEKLEDEIEASMPDTLKDAMKFASRNKGKKIGKAVGSIVEGDVQSVESTYKEVENAPEPEPPPPNTPLNEIEPVQETPPMALGDGLVPPTSEEQTDLTEYDNESDNLLKKEGLPEEQLEMVDSGDLAEARQHRKDVKKKKTEEPAKIKAFEQHKRLQTKISLEKEEKKTKVEMRAKRTKELENSKKEQKNAKSSLEKKREEVTKKINSIYETANKQVKSKLKSLKESSLAAFDKAEKKSSKEFEGNVKRRLKAFKRRRYGGRWGGAKWLKDKLLGMDDLPEVLEIFDTEKASFTNKIDSAIKDITKANKKVIKECKELIAKAKTDIATFVKGLGPALKKTGLEAQKKMKEKLDKLDKDVNKAEKEINKKLQEKREAAIKAIEKKIEKMKEEMSGLLAKLGNLLLDALLKFFKWALKKAGYSPDQLMGVIDKGKAVITKIVKDPKGFFRNLGTAVGNGIKNFVKNIKSWLIKGLITWLTGAMGDSGLVLPEKFDAKGIFSLALQAMGISWTFIRSRIVRHVPEKLVAAAEKGFEVLIRIKKDGPKAIIPIVKEKIGEVKTAIMEGIRNWIILQVVKKATIKLLSMLNPVGAIVQAILTIYDLVMFFIENWDRIVQFVKSVFNSIADIAMGNLGKAAKLVENALGMTIPIILSFLARFLGLSGIGKAIRKIISKLRTPVVKMVDKFAKAIGKKLKKWKGKAKEKVAGLVQWWKKRKRLKTKNNESHTIYFKGTGKGAKLTIASSPQSYVTYLNGLKQQYKLKEGDIAAAKAKATQIETEVRKNVPANQQQAQANKIHGMIDELATLTMNIPIPDAGGTNTSPIYGPIRKGFGTFARVVYLQSPHPKGSDPSLGNTPEYNAINMRRVGNGSFYIKGHLLNENLGGPGTTWSNLTPLTQKANSDHKTQFENPVKMAVNGQTSGYSQKTLGYMKEFKVRAVYGRGPNQKLINDLLSPDVETEDIPNFPENTNPDDLAKVLTAEQYVPTSLDCSATVASKTGGKEKKISKPIKNDIKYGKLNHYSLTQEARQPLELASLIDYSTSDENKAIQKLLTLNGIGAKRAIKIYKAFNTSGRIYNFKSQIGVTKKTIEKANPKYKIKSGTK